jgi:hypothetical protein
MFFLFLAWALTNAKARVTFGALAIAFFVTITPIFTSKVFYSWPGVTRSPSLLVFATFNQYLGTIAQAKEPLRSQLIAQEAKYFDAYFGEGKLEQALSKYEPSFNGTIVWGEKAVIGFGPILNSEELIFSRFPLLVAQSPSSFLRHKLLYIKGLLHDSSVTYPFQVVSLEAANFVGVSFPPVFEYGNKLVYGLLNKARFWPFYRHWFMMLTCCIAALLWKFFLKSKIPAPSLYLLGFSFLYMIPYLILETGSGSEWRYLMPSFCTQLLALIIGVGFVYPSRG